MHDTLGKRILKIAFLHPDLGLGGAERLVVDCAVGLVEQVSTCAEHREIQSCVYTPFFSHAQPTFKQYTFYVAGTCGRNVYVSI